MHSLSINIKIEERLKRSALLENLKIEALESRTKRAYFLVNEFENQIFIKIVASDLIMLRAFSNSVFRILKTCMDVLTII